MGKIKGKGMGANANGTGCDKLDSTMLTGVCRVFNVRICHASGVLLLEDSCIT